MTDAAAPVVPAPGGARAAGTGPAAALRVLAAVALVVTVLGATAVLSTLAAIPPERTAGLNSPAAVVLQMVGMAGLAAAGAVLARQQPRTAIAWLMLCTALAWVLSYLSLLLAMWLLGTGSRLAPAAGWLTNWSWVPAHALSMLLLLRFPDGRLPGRRWRTAESAVAAWAATAFLTTALLPGPLGAEPLAPLTNPLGVEALSRGADGTLSALFAVLPALVVLCAAAPVVRWRRAGTRERGALRWLALAALVVAASAPLALLTDTGEVLQGLAFLLLPTAIGTAVLRERLWDLGLRRRYDRLREAREQERERLRRELHDSLGPLLGSVSMRAEAARNLLARPDGGTPDPRVDALLASIGSTTEGALGEVRRLIDDLGPEALRDRDLVPALVDHVRPYADTFPVTVTTRPDPLPPLDPEAAATAYLVVVEAVRNAARHSGATGAEVHLQTVGDDLRVEVRDEGRGLGDSPAGVGRRGMERRVAEQGGRLELLAPEGSGTVVRLRLPGARW